MKLDILAVFDQDIDLTLTLKSIPLPVIYT